MITHIPKICCYRQLYALRGLATSYSSTFFEVIIAAWKKLDCHDVMTKVMLHSLFGNSYKLNVHSFSIKKIHIFKIY